MRQVRTLALVCLMLLSSLLTASFMPTANAAEGKAKVYVICLPNVPTENSWVNNPADVKDGAIDAYMIDGEEIDSDIPKVHPKDGTAVPYYFPSLYVVTSWSYYKGIITGQSGVIVVNAHGQYLPVPSPYSKEGWVEEIADSMNERRVTWVHVAGYPFNYTYKQDGTIEQWGTGGFAHLMDYGLHMSNVNCNPPAGKENRKATLDIGGFQQVGLGWEYLSQNYKKATVGKPLKFSDFKEYLAMWLYTSTWENVTYLSGAVVVFGKASIRSKRNDGIGAYVHLGSRRFYDKNDNEQPADVARGYVATAVALWHELSGFSPSGDVEDYNYMEHSGQIGVSVCPSIVHLDQTGSYYYVKLAFSITGTLNVDEDDGDLYFQGSDLGVWIHRVTGEFSDITMKVDKPMSKIGEGDDPLFSGLYPDSGAGTDFMISAVMWYFSVIPGVGSILWPINGLRLFSTYIKLLSWVGTGVGDTYEPYIDAWHDYLCQLEEVQDGIRYQQVSAIAVIELQVPRSTTTP